MADAPSPPGTSIFIDPPRIEQPLLARFKAYWDGKRGARPMPRRRDIDPPLELRPLLPHLFLIDVLPGDFRYRLLGTGLTARFGRDSTGKQLSELFAPGDPIGRWLGGIYGRVVRDRVPILGTAPLDQVGKSYVVGAAIHLPLAGDRDEVAMIIGATQFGDAWPPA